MSVIRGAFSHVAATPVVGVVCDRQLIEDAPYLVCEERYVTAVREGAGVIPFLIPSMEKKILAADEILSHVGGLVFTGSPSNVHPGRYDPLNPSATPQNHDPARDAIALPLLEAALERGVPILATCRGMQEMNVACGGSLYQNIHATKGYLDHREDATLPYEAMYEPAHSIDLEPNGFFADLCDKSKNIMVNSLHDQGIDRLGDGLVIEAVAPDGLIEAIRYVNHPFAIGTQFHPEWGFEQNSLSINLFKAFGMALRKELDLRENWPLANYYQIKSRVTL